MTRRRRGAAIAVNPRPELGPALEALLEALVAAVDALQSVDAGAILVVAGQARGEARASIRPLGEGVLVRVAGRRRHHEITLRPPWFRTATPERRLESLVHELWHIAPGEPGQLHPGRRHQASERRRERRELAALVQQARASLEPQLLACLAHDGEWLVPCWLHRPVLTGEQVRRKRFGDRDLYQAPQRMIVPAAELAHDDEAQGGER